MKTRFLVVVISIASICGSIALCSRNKVNSIATRGGDQLRSGDRATTMYRILNEAGIKFERTRTKVFRSISSEKYAAAQEICATFLVQIESIRNGTKRLTSLDADDLRYVQSSLDRMKRRIEQVQSDLPFSDLLSR